MPPSKAKKQLSLDVGSSPNVTSPNSAGQKMLITPTRRKPQAIPSSLRRHFETKPNENDNGVPVESSAVAKDKATTDLCLELTENPSQIFEFVNYIPTGIRKRISKLTNKPLGEFGTLKYIDDENLIIDEKQNIVAEVAALYARKNSESMSKTQNTLISANEEDIIKQKEEILRSRGFFLNLLDLIIFLWNLHFKFLCSMKVFLITCFNCVTFFFSGVLLLAVVFLLIPELSRMEQISKKPMAGLLQEKWHDYIIIFDDIMYSQEMLSNKQFPKPTSSNSITNSFVLLSKVHKYTPPKIGSFIYHPNTVDFINLYPEKGIYGVHGFGATPNLDEGSFVVFNRTVADDASMTMISETVLHNYTSTFTTFSNFFAQLGALNSNSGDFVGLPVGSSMIVLGSPVSDSMMEYFSIVKNYNGTLFGVTIASEGYWSFFKNLAEHYAMKGVFFGVQKYTADSISLTYAPALIQTEQQSKNGESYSHLVEYLADIGANSPIYDELNFKYLDEFDLDVYYWRGKPTNSSQIYTIYPLVSHETIQGFILDRYNTMNHVIDKELIIAFSVILCAVSIVVSITISLLLSYLFTTPLIQFGKQLQLISTMDLEKNFRNTVNFSEFAALENQLNQMKQGLKSFGKYVPIDLVRILLKRGIDAKAMVEDYDISIFFMDIANFTTMTEKLNPEEFVTVMSMFFNRMTDNILSTGGQIDKFIGDCIMALWGCPIKMEDHQVRCAKACLNCVNILTTLNKEYQALGLKPISVRIGANCGKCLVGNLGSTTRLNYTALGDNVNLASRLEGVNKAYNTRVMFSDSLYMHVFDKFVCRPIDLITVQGRKKPIQTYELVAEVGTDPESLKLQSAVYKYHRAFQYYRERNFVQAKKLFVEFQQKKPIKYSDGRDDFPTQMMIDRCNTFIAKPPAPDWDYVYATHKEEH